MLRAVLTGAESSTLSPLPAHLPHKLITPLQEPQGRVEFSNLTRGRIARAK